MDDADLAWRALVAALKVWGEKHMDQFEMVQWDTEYGPIYVTISRHCDYPDAYEKV